MITITFGVPRCKIRVKNYRRHKVASNHDDTLIHPNTSQAFDSNKQRIFSSSLPHLSSSSMALDSIHDVKRNHTSRTYNCKYFSTNSSSSSPDYLTNDGIIEGVWMFFRHGDRTPSRPLSPMHRRDDEAEFWITKLPIPSTLEAYEAFSERFPLLVHPSPPTDTSYLYSSMTDPKYQMLDKHQGKFIDASRYPFGFLTDKGLLQLCENGRRFYNRYHLHGTTGASDLNPNDGTCSPEEFLKKWDVRVFSTNYLRTIMSVQSFLDGMLNTKIYETIRSNNIQSAISAEVERQQYEDMKSSLSSNRVGKDTIQKRMPDHSWPLKALVGTNDEAMIFGTASSKRNSIHDTNNKPHGPVIPIQVRDLSRDPLNAFDRNPALISELVNEVMLSETFLTRDGNAAPLAARLANILPGLVRPKNSSNQQKLPPQQQQQQKTPKPPKKGSDFSTKTPSGINWVEASDHFVCRTAHNVPLAKFSDYEHNEHIEQTLQAMSYQTIAHLAWRFRQWYHHQRLLAAIAAPALREIVNQMKRTPNLSESDRRPLVIYSCHDVTILGLLYALGADFLANDDNEKWRYWPPYGTNLVFELVRIPTQQQTEQSRLQPIDARSYVVRILLNGKPILTVDFKTSHQDKELHYTGTGPHKMLHITEFEEIVSRLEKDGGDELKIFLDKTRERGT